MSGDYTPQRKSGAFFVKTVNEYNTLITNGTVTQNDKIEAFKSKIVKVLKTESRTE